VAEMHKRMLITILLVMGLAAPKLLAGQGTPLSDRVEAVVIKGKSLPPAFLGAPIASYRVFAASGGRPMVIPMQIDECDDSGLIMVKQGPKAEKGDGLFHARDELVFMARDAGALYTGTPAEGCPKTVTVTLTDSQTGAQGQVILAQCDHPPPLSPVSYVHYDPNTRTAITDRYRLGWHMAPVYYYDYITVKDGPDLLDRLKVRCTVGKWNINYTFNEEHFHYQFIGFTQGPVRVFWKSVNYWSLGPLGKIPLPAYGTFYPEYVLLQDPMDARFNPALFGLDLTVIIAHDLALDRTRGYKLCVNVAPECISLAAPLPADKVKALSEQNMSWGGVSGPEGALITHFVLDPKLNARVIGEFRDDDQFKNPPEYQVGSSPMIAFKMINWKNVKPAIYDLTFYHFFLDHYSIPEFERFDRMVTSPLAVSAK